ncbi:MAG: SpoIID/LytB domain-containing protein [Nitrospirae bacterium]|nr:MAG: SpoIID/LytB domain-containing protein [Nitrospirota bacterium]
MDLSPVKQLRGTLYRAIVAGACLLSLSSGTEAAESIRVLLSADVSRLDIRADSPLWVTDAQGRGQALRAQVQVTAAGTGFLQNGVRMQTEQLTLHAGAQGLTLTFPRPARKLNGAAMSSGDSGTEISVSGVVHLVRRGKGFLVINRVDIEEYVKGVVPAEVSSTWHPEMLKAQAVAARTYALYQQMLSATRDYDVASTVQDQVYRGKEGIDVGILRAVEDTRGLVVTYQDAPIFAAFSSTAAGLTEDAMNVWSKDYPYLKGVECPFDLTSPYYQWKSSFKIDTLEQNLRQQGFSVGTIATMAPLLFSRGGRVAKLRILHSGGELILRGEELRKVVGYTVIPSTQFAIESIGQDVVLSGFGAGHAVGMCQWGAKELAELGYSFSTILQYYYPGTELQNMALTKPPTPPPS